MCADGADVKNVISQNWFFANFALPHLRTLVFVVGVCVCVRALYLLLVASYIRTVSDRCVISATLTIAIKCQIEERQILTPTFELNTPQMDAYINIFH